MSKVVAIEPTNGGFIVERLSSNKQKSVHTDLPCALAAASDLLQDDKPELPELQEQVLISIRDEVGCVFKLNGYWRYYVVKGRSDVGGSYACCEDTITEMIEAGLLSTSCIRGRAGVERVVYITDSGKKAIRS